MFDSGNHTKKKLHSLEEWISLKKKKKINRYRLDDFIYIIVSQMPASRLEFCIKFHPGGVDWRNESGDDFAINKLTRSVQWPLPFPLLQWCCCYWVSIRESFTQCWKVGSFQNNQQLKSGEDFVFMAHMKKLSVLPVQE